MCSSLQEYDTITLTEHEIASSLACSKSNKAPGPDGLRGRVLKDCTRQLKAALTKQFRLPARDVCSIQIMENFKYSAHF